MRMKIRMLMYLGNALLFLHVFQDVVTTAPLRGKPHKKKDAEREEDVSLHAHPPLWMSGRIDQPFVNGSQIVGDASVLHTLPAFCKYIAALRVHIYVHVFGDQSSDCYSPCTALITLRCQGVPTTGLDSLQVHCKLPRLTGQIRLAEGIVYTSVDRGDYKTLVPQGTYRLTRQMLHLAWNGAPSDKLSSADGITFNAQRNDSFCQILHKHIHHYVTETLNALGINSIEALILSGRHPNSLSILASASDRLNINASVIVTDWHQQIESEIPEILGCTPPTFKQHDGLAQWTGKCNTFQFAGFKGNILTNFLTTYALLPLNTYKCSPVPRLDVCILGMNIAEGEKYLIDWVCNDTMNHTIVDLCADVTRSFCTDLERGCDIALLSPAWLYQHTEMVKDASSKSLLLAVRQQLVLLHTSRIVNCSMGHGLGHLLDDWMQQECHGHWSTWRRKQNILTWVYTTRPNQEARVIPSLTTWVAHSGPALFYSTREDHRAEMPHFKVVQNTAYDLWDEVCPAACHILPSAPPPQRCHNGSIFNGTKSVVALVTLARPCPLGLLVLVFSFPVPYAHLTYRFFNPIP